MLTRAGIIAGTFAPTYLPTVGSSPSAVYGTRKLVASYAGSCVRVVRASDTTEQDIGFDANGIVDMTAAATFAASSELTVKTWYDQTANGNDATQGTGTSQPRLRSANAMRGLQGITFDASVNTGGNAKTLSIPSGVALDRRNVTYFSVAAPHSDYNNNMNVILGTSTTGAAIFSSPGHNFGLHLGAPQYGSRLSRFNPSINALRGGASASKLYTDSGSDALSVGTAGSNTGGTIGGDGGFGATFSLRGEYFGLAVYPAALSDADVTSVQTALKTAFTVSYAQNRLIVFEGDSITEGQGQTFLKNNVRLTYEAMIKDAHVYNSGVAGTSASTEYARRVAKFGGMNRGDSAVKICVLGIGSNDLKSGTTGANLWTNSLLPYIQYIQSLGFTVIVATVIPRNDTWTVGLETERAAVNGLITSNASTYGYTVADYTTLAQFDAQADASNTTYYGADTIHPNSTGYGLMSGLLTLLINAI